LKSGSLNLLEPSGPVQACNATALPYYLLIYGGWRSWLRHCPTSWKVAGSILVGVIGIFH
jgi:hypothetical protein